MKRSLYEVLGVASDAGFDEITLAYRRAVERIEQSPQPDPNALVIVREAYRVLGNDARKTAYDASLRGTPRPRSADPAREESPASPGSDTGTNPWIKWGIAAAVLLGVAGGWKWLRSPPTPAATMVGSRAPDQPAPAAPAAPPQAAATQPSPEAAGAAPRPRTAEDIFAEIAPSVARVNVLDASGRAVATGSGVVIEAGTLITNCHVARRGPQLNVKIGQDTLPAELSLADEALDLCQLRVAGLEAPSVEIGSVASLRTGQKVFAIGAPQGLDLTISDGIVSSLREVAGGTVIQTTAPISPGSSGGGLFNTAGQLVGIMTFQHRYGQNLNFALPADWIGEMQARAGSAAPARVAVAPASPPAADEPQSLLLGRWWCFGPLTGRNGDWTFNEDGTLSMVMGGQDLDGRYTVRGKSLYLLDRGTMQLKIEELTEQRMVLNAGKGSRIACERR